MNIYKNVSESSDLEPIYNDWLTGEHVESQFRDYSYYHPSDLGYCIRKSVMMKMGYEGVYYTLPRLQRIFENGHGTHARYQEHFSRMGILYGRWECNNCYHVMGKEELLGIPRPSSCEKCNNPKTKTVYDNNGNCIFGPYALFTYQELPVEDKKMGVKGHTDGVVKIKNGFHVVDFKTCSQSGFSEVSISCLPMEAHVYQINIYMHLLGLDRGILLYENRNDLKIKEFLLFKDNEIIAEVIKRIIIGEKSIANGVIPDIPGHLMSNSFACAGYPGCPPCPFYGRCFPEQYKLAQDTEPKYKDFVRTKAAAENEA